MSKPTRAVVGPVLTIGLVVLAFTFIPWLSGGETNRRAARPRPRRCQLARARECAGNVERAKAVDVEKLGEEAVGGIRQAGSGLQKNVGGLREDVKDMRKNVQDLNKNVDDSNKDQMKDPARAARRTATTAVRSAVHSPRSDHPGSLILARTLPMSTTYHPPAGHGPATPT